MKNLKRFNDIKEMTIRLLEDTLKQAKKITV